MRTKVKRLVQCIISTDDDTIPDVRHFDIALLMRASVTDEVTRLLKKEEIRERVVIVVIECDPEDDVRDLIGVTFKGTTQFFLLVTTIAGADADAALNQTTLPKIREMVNSRDLSMANYEQLSRLTEATIRTLDVAPNLAQLAGAYRWLDTIGLRGCERYEQWREYWLDGKDALREVLDGRRLYEDCTQIAYVYMRPSKKTIAAMKANSKKIRDMLASPALGMVKTIGFLAESMRICENQHRNAVPFPDASRTTENIDKLSLSRLFECLDVRVTGAQCYRLALAIITSSVVMPEPLLTLATRVVFANRNDIAKSFGLDPETLEILPDDQVPAAAFAAKMIIARSTFRNLMQPAVHGEPDQLAADRNRDRNFHLTVRTLRAIHMTAINAKKPPASAMECDTGTVCFIKKYRRPGGDPNTNLGSVVTVTCKKRTNGRPVRRTARVQFIDTDATDVAKSTAIVRYSDMIAFPGVTPAEAECVVRTSAKQKDNTKRDEDAIFELNRLMQNADVGNKKIEQCTIGVDAYTLAIAVGFSPEMAKTLKEGGGKKPKRTTLQEIEARGYDGLCEPYRPCLDKERRNKALGEPGIRKAAIDARELMQPLPPARAIGTEIYNCSICLEYDFVKRGILLACGKHYLCPDHAPRVCKPDPSARVWIDPNAHRCPGCRACAVASDDTRAIALAVCAELDKASEDRGRVAQCDCGTIMHEISNENRGCAAEQQESQIYAPPCGDCTQVQGLIQCPNCKHEFEKAGGCDLLTCCTLGTEGCKRTSQCPGCKGGTLNLCGHRWSLHVCHDDEID